MGQDSGAIDNVAQVNGLQGGRLALSYGFGDWCALRGHSGGGVGWCVAWKSVHAGSGEAWDSVCVSRQANGRPRR